MRNSALNTAEPWYRQGWPWFLIAIPATAVVAGAVTLGLAIQSWDGLVVDDYYQQGKTIEKTIARSLRAKEMGLTADLRIRSDSIEVGLSSTGDAVLSPTVVVTIAHPTRAGYDQKLLLTRGAEGRFAGPLSPLSTGRWLVQLEDEAGGWRLAGAVHLPHETVVRILPSDS